MKTNENKFYGSSKIFTKIYIIRIITNELNTIKYESITTCRQV